MVHFDKISSNSITIRQRGMWKRKTTGGPEKTEAAYLPSPKRGNSVPFPASYGSFDLNVAFRGANDSFFSRNSTSLRRE